MSVRERGNGKCIYKVFGVKRLVELGGGRGQVLYADWCFFCAT